MQGFQLAAELEERQLEQYMLFVADNLHQVGDCKEEELDCDLMEEVELRSLVLVVQRSLVVAVQRTLEVVVPRNLVA